MLIATENALPERRGSTAALLSRRAGRRDPGEPHVSVDECEHGAGRIHAMGLARAVSREHRAHRPRAVRAGCPEDSVDFLKLQQPRVSQRSPVLEALRTHPKQIALAAGTFLAVQVPFYILIAFVIAYGTVSAGPAVSRNRCWPQCSSERSR